MAFLQTSKVRDWYLFTTGQVLQLNITIKPFFFIASLNETSVPEISFIFTSGLGTGDPIGKGSLRGFRAIIEMAATGIAANKIFFI
jgi:hypothetical protein